MRTVLAERVVDGLTPQVAIDALTVRPLLVGGVAALARTAPFRRVVAGVARRRHGALLDGDGGYVFDLAARGAVLLDAVRSISPRVADKVPRGLQVPIVSLRPRRFELVAVEWLTRIAGWWWPLLGASVLAAAACAALAGGVRDALVRLGLAAAGAGLAVAGLVAGLGSFAVAHAANAANFDSDAERGALAALWAALFGNLRTAGLLAAVGGVVLAVLASGALAADRLAAARAWALRTVRSPGTAAHIARAALVAALGLALILAPSLTVRVAAVITGAALLLAGVAQLAARRAELPRDPPRRARGTGRRAVSLPAPQEFPRDLHLQRLAAQRALEPADLAT